MSIDKIKESIKFGLIMIFFGFITSYLTDFLNNREIILLPEHSSDMASGTFFTSILVYYLFSDKYIKYKCK